MRELIVRRVLILVFGFGVSCCILVAFWTGTSRNHVISFEQLPTQTAPEDLRILPVDSLQPADITLPATIKGTAMVVQKLASYDGAFFEDGTNEEVAGVAALLVHNSGTTGILKAEIVLQRGELCMVFCAELIPAGKSVLILEKDRKPYLPGNYTQCSGWAVTEPGNWQKEEKIRIETTDLAGITVKNLTDEELRNIRLYYKITYADNLFYLGGISYQVLIDRLAPGQSIRLEPEHYCAGQSHFVYVDINAS